jgi:Uncharacterized protein conserved in bacteria (DUF2252)
MCLSCVENRSVPIVIARLSSAATRSADDPDCAAGERNQQLRSQPFGRRHNPARRSRSRDETHPAPVGGRDAGDPATGDAGREPSNQAEVAQPGVSRLPRSGERDPGARLEAALQFYGALCGRTLVRAHARAGDAVETSGYMGDQREFDKAIAEFAMAYADQTERDWRAMEPVGMR